MVTEGWMTLLFLNAEDLTSDIEKSISAEVAGRETLIVGVA